jgi:hypothetical protein
LDGGGDKRGNGFDYVHGGQTPVCKTKEWVRTHSSLTYIIQLTGL